MKPVRKDKWGEGTTSQSLLKCNCTTSFFHLMLLHIPSFIYVVCVDGVHSSHFYVVFHCVALPSLFMNSTVDRPLNCFQFGVIANSAAMNATEMVSGTSSKLLYCIYQEGEWPGPQV